MKPTGVMANRLGPMYRNTTLSSAIINIIIENSERLALFLPLWVKQPGRS